MYVTTSFPGLSLPLSMEEKGGNEVEHVVAKSAI